MNRNDFEVNNLNPHKKAMFSIGLKNLDLFYKQNFFNYQCSSKDKAKRTRNPEKWASRKYSLIALINSLVFSIFTGCATSNNNNGTKSLSIKFLTLNRLL